MSETFKRGDRVIVRDVVDGTNRDYVGRVGTLRIVSPDGRYVVLMDGPGDVRIVATAVESLIETLASAQERVSAQSPVAVGDRVVIRAAENHDWRDEEAAVEKLHRYGIIDDETLRHELQRINDERRRTAPDKKRTQAMEFARRILGTDADLDDLLRLAEWALNEQTERVTFNPGGVIFTPNDAETTRRLAEGLVKSGRIVAEPQETPRPPANLEIRDKDGDRVTFSYLAGPHYFAMVEARNTDGDVCSAYITPDDADRITAFLQDAKAAKA